MPVPRALAPTRWQIWRNASCCGRFATCSIARCRHSWPGRRCRRRYLRSARLAVHLDASGSLAALKQRAALLRKVRQFFDERGFVEVETPLLASEIIPELHIEPFRV